MMIAAPNDSWLLRACVCVIGCMCVCGFASSAVGLTICCSFSQSQLAGLFTDWCLPCSSSAFRLGLRTCSPSSLPRHHCLFCRADSMPLSFVQQRFVVIWSKAVISRVHRLPIRGACSRTSSDRLRSYLQSQPCVETGQKVGWSGRNKWQAFLANFQDGKINEEISLDSGSKAISFAFTVFLSDAFAEVFNLRRV